MVDNGSSRSAILVLNSDRGLCGRFRGEVNRRGEEFLAEAGPEAQLLVGGEKGRAHFARLETEMLKVYTRTYDTPTPETASSIAGDLIELYEEGVVGRCVAVGRRPWRDDWAGH